MKKIGLIGCGNIGRFLLQAINEDQVLPDYRIHSILHLPTDEVESLIERYQVQTFTDFAPFIQSGIDLALEAANIQTVQNYAREVLQNGKDLLMISVGALVDTDLFAELNRLCYEHQCHLYLPSGAIGGLDVLKAAVSVGELHSVSITTRKPPQALSAQSIDQEVVLFDGSATQAIQQFPQNINVAIILSLAGIGSDQTRVKIIADPRVTKNTHCIEATGSFGRLTVTVENDPMPNNPKTSYLAALSILSKLRSLGERVHIG